METIAIAARKRNSALSAKNLRKTGFLPAEVYGGGHDNVSVEMDYQNFRKVYLKAGENTLIDLTLGDAETRKVLVRDVAFDPVSGQITHVDFVNVRMDKEVHTRIPLQFVGVSLAVKDMEGTLITSINEVEVKCLPHYLVPFISVDISGIIDFHTSIHVKDLVVPEGIKVLNEAGATVASVLPPQKEEEVAPVAAPIEGAAVPGTEGAAAAPGAEAGAAGATPAGAPAGEKKK